MSHDEIEQVAELVAEKLRHSPGHFCQLSQEVIQDCKDVSAMKRTVSKTALIATVKALMTLLYILIIGGIVLWIRTKVNE